MATENTLPANNYPGTLHTLPNNVFAFEPSKPLVRSLDINTLVWVGGMGDTVGSVAYPFTIAQSLGPKWSLVTCSLRSAGPAWGVRSLATDAEDMASIISHLKERRPGGKVVIMGHSTGCQDCMEYTVGTGADKRPSVDGVILQAPVSDREALENELPQAFKHEVDQLALKMCQEGQDKDAMPNRLTGPVFGRVAISARRWVDVSSPGPDHSGADDYFSSDLPVERLKGTFGKLPPSSPLLVLYSGSDASVPQVNATALLEQWTSLVKESGGNIDDKNGGIVVGASHNLNNNPGSVVQDLVTRVVKFIDRIDGGFGGNSSRI
ncbi:hypothetical protein M409DRAFT_23133 [Zasmidium cellare ATCC 36951]|uniref:DUF1749-domain-containing protein n=1 Tax=Zasmidium cellare ATCC 36951 TaxID=1080233 RepID=A0A6A6CM31_ZASCE|nr:uncharacterized protein M409DRAFT_23133 [Zasmidium cellare ATCC 36951]KAF2166496.1 hypothetical protein M409DRAFT_23133 [Zasmidium cellare ATCC 36951]